MSIERSTEVAELFKALAQAQGEFTNAVENKNNPAFKSDYADLASVRAAVKAPLAKHGLAIMQHPITLNGQLWLQTSLVHSSGQYVASAFALNVEKPTMQGLKSAITYARRASMLSILGIAESDDDDGNEAEAYPKPKAPAPVKAKPEPKAQTTPAVPAQATQASQDSFESLGELVCPVGSLKGKPLKEVSTNDLGKYLDGLNNWLEKNKTDAATAEFYNKAESYYGKLVEVEERAAIKSPV